MIYIFPETKEANERAEKVLKSLKHNYKQVQMSEEQLECLRQTIKTAKQEERVKKERKHKYHGAAMAISACLALFLILPNTSFQVAYAMEQIPMIGNLVRLVTFRDYHYETQRHSADVKVDTIALVENTKSVGLEKTTSEINQEIQEITDELVHDFEQYMHDEMGYQQLNVESIALPTISGYFTLKLCCYQGAGSGYEWNYYYTIDLNSGKRLELKDLFAEGADYITPISENIKLQMKEQMKEDKMVMYWLDEEIEDWNFEKITDDTSFYLNEYNNIVIAFNEGDVAPMYMGTVEFEIPAEVLKDIRKSS